eukprot:EG_transcript_60348
MSTGGSPRPPPAYALPVLLARALDLISACGRASLEELQAVLSPELQPPTAEGIAAWLAREPQASFLGRDPAGCVVPRPGAPLHRFAEQHGLGLTAAPAPHPAASSCP